MLLGGGFECCMFVFAIIVSATTEHKKFPRAIPAAEFFCAEFILFSLRYLFGPCSPYPASSILVGALQFLLFSRAV